MLFAITLTQYDNFCRRLNYNTTRSYFGDNYSASHHLTNLNIAVTNENDTTRLFLTDMQINLIATMIVWGATYSTRYSINAISLNFHHKYFFDPKFDTRIVSSVDDSFMQEIKKMTEIKLLVSDENDYFSLNFKDLAAEVKEENNCNNELLTSAPLWVNNNVELRISALEKIELPNTPSASNNYASFFQHTDMPASPLAEMSDNIEFNFLNPNY